MVVLVTNIAILWHCTVLSQVRTNLTLRAPHLCNRNRLERHHLGGQRHRRRGIRGCPRLRSRCTPQQLMRRGSHGSSSRPSPFFFFFFFLDILRAAPAAGVSWV